jgi:hypothetical protein
MGPMERLYNSQQVTLYIDQLRDRLRRTEDQLALLSERLGIPYERPGDGVPPEVAALVEAGDRLGAMRKYRELTGAGAQEAQEAIGRL